MAKSCALLLVGLMLASLCVANAGRFLDRKLLVGDALDAVLGGVLDDLEIQCDLRQLSSTVETGKAKLVDLGVPVDLEGGKISKLTAANVKLQDGCVSVELAILGVDKVVVLDLKKLEPTLEGGKLVAVLVFVVDDVKHVLHLQDKDGNCVSDLAFNFSVGVTVSANP